MKAKMIIYLLSFVTTYSISQVSNKDILADLDSLDLLIKEYHVNPFWITSQEEFASVVSSARNTILNNVKSPEHIYVEFLKVVAAIKDGHSSINANSRYELFGYLPLSISWYGGELRVMRTIDRYEKILGSKIVAVNGVPISSFLDRMSVVVPQANKYRFQKFVGSYIHLPGLLYGLDITTDPSQTTFTFEKENNEYQVTISDLSPEDEEKATFVSYTEELADPAWYQQKNSKYYWYNYDRDNKLFYFQYNRIGSMKSESSSAFAERMWKEVDSLEIDKFILDLRYNGGGNFAYSLGFIQGIIDREKINQRGKLFIITGYNTFSAAMEMLNILEMTSSAIVIGEYPCDRPSRPGDAEVYSLPRTGIKVNLSSLYHPSAMLNDQRISNSLDKEIVTTWDHYKNGVDPSLDYICSFKEEVRQLINPEHHKSAIGSYDYSPTRDIKIKTVQGNLWLEISKAVDTPIYWTVNGRYKTEIPGMEIVIMKNSIILYSPDGSHQFYMKASNSRMSPIDLVYEGKMFEASGAFLNIRFSHPEFIETQDHMMSSLANTAFFSSKNNPDINATDLAREILKLGIELNQEAPFCEYSLRFYPEN